MNRLSKIILRDAEIALLAALIAVLQWVGGLTTGMLPVQLSFVLIPIVIGGALFGATAGAALGGVFGLLTIYGVVVGGGLFGFLFQQSPWLIIAICMLKGMAAGWVGGAIATALRRRGKEFLGVVLAAAAVPVVNTGIFCAGMFLFEAQLVEAFGTPNVFYIIFIGLAGLNFLVEFGINLVVSPAMERILRAVRKAKL